MNVKIIALILLFIVLVKNLLIDILEKKSIKNELNPNVKDIYNDDEYKRWTLYQNEKVKLSIIIDIVDFILIFVLLTFDLLKYVSFLTNNVYLDSIILICIYTLIDTLLKLYFNYYNNIIIETKYGFNKATKKTFIIDTLKDMIISGILLSLLIVVFVYFYSLLNDYILIVFFGILLLFIIVINLLAPLSQKIYNKFQSLEEGPLRVKLINLLEKHNYHVKDIKIMDGSKRSTKANAYFSGLGKSKTIVLYDTIINLMTEDELVSVFCHELAHGKKKHILKQMLISSLLIAIFAFLVWGIVKLPIYQYFGLKDINYGFALFLLSSTILPFVLMVFNVFSMKKSRDNEYEADSFATKEGYGNELISALKKLSKNSFVNLTPNNIVVFLLYSHPPISKRIDNIEKVIKEYEKI